ncbi:MAG: fimbrial assembly protein fimC, partial [Clostridia bacterium]|nr:fimbrial assembly protein fimC [Clostridia bacterium]
KLAYVTLYNWFSGFGGFITLLLLPFYNGERGNMPKWTWYVFYPVHLIVILAIIIIIF